MTRKIRFSAAGKSDHDAHSLIFCGGKEEHCAHSRNFSSGKQEQDAKNVKKRSGKVSTTRHGPLFRRAKEEHDAHCSRVWLLLTTLSVLLLFAGSETRGMMPIPGIFLPG
ncbi:MAG: hypothetical protein JWM68_5111, partial [Verrucomicrobiales bacterium]|nr:hypothetical protein [Verrucomicrobiales bacterium]